MDNLPEGASQGSSEWLEERAGKATASRFVDVMASKNTIARQSYATQLAIERITGKPTQTYKNADMDRGNELEPLARLRYQLYSRLSVEVSPFLQHPTLMAGASPDGLIGEDGLVEFKAPRNHNHLMALKQKKVPPQYIWQVYGQMWITGRQWCDFVSFTDEEAFQPHAAMAIVRVERDEEKIKLLEDTVTMFLDEVSSIVKFILEYK